MKHICQKMPWKYIYIYTCIWHMAWLWHHVLIISIVVPNSGQRLFTESPTLRPLRSGSGSSIHLGGLFHGNPNRKWMRTEGTPMTQESFILRHLLCGHPKKIRLLRYQDAWVPSTALTMKLLVFGWPVHHAGRWPLFPRTAGNVYRKTFPVTNPLKQRFGIGIHEPPTMVQDSKWHLLLFHCSIGFLFLGTFHWKGLKELQ